MDLFAESKERGLNKTVAVLIVSVFSFYLISKLDPNDILILLRPEELAAVIGPYGPPGVIFAQMIQVVIAPIPPVTPVVGGLLYGPWLGALYSVIGASIGSVIGILLARRYGRPVVERFVKDSIMERFDSYTQKTGYLPFIVLFVFPGFPDDALCFIAGLTKLDWKNMAFIASIGRIPGILMLTTTGHSIAETKPLLFIAASSMVVAVSILSVKYQEDIENFIRSGKSRVM